MLVDITVTPDELHDTALHSKMVYLKAKLSIGETTKIVLRKRSLDARKKRPLYHLRYEIVPVDAPVKSLEFDFKNVSNAEPVIIVGFGPAGMFAGLRLLELGLKPIIFEQGNDVRTRRFDLANITKRGIVNERSNYCFGEGGAGTFSDGKLYTRSKKRGSVDSVLKKFVYHGASEDILIDAHPHIGTNKLPKVVQAIRQTIIDCGGEVHFNTKISSIIRDSDSCKGVVLENGESITARAVILATGHSARDIFTMLDRQEIAIEYKPFSLGLRVEHPQSLIDSMQYHCATRHDNLPPASYALVTQAKERGVFSFCMCPGGIICPSATNNSEVVVNGWSPSKRNSKYANSGIVVEVKESDLKPFQKHGALAGIYFQKSVEEKAAISTGGNQVAPALRLQDFVSGKISAILPDCSYIPGLQAVDFKSFLSKEFIQRLQIAFRVFNQSLQGYLTNEAIVVGVESRTSSPVRIPRDKETLQHIQLAGLFPSGEGAGYAGGIVSAAIDGENIADAVFRSL